MTYTLTHRLTAVVFIAAASLIHAQNLVTNGGFENNLTGWSNAMSGGASASFALETAQPYGGARAMKVVVTNPGSQLHNVQTLGPTFTLPTGTPTTITFRARAAVAGTTVRFVMQNAVYKKKAEVEQLIFDDLGLDIIRLKNWYFPADWPTNKSPSNIPTTGGFRGNYHNNKTFYDMAKANGRDISIQKRNESSASSPPSAISSMKSNSPATVNIWKRNRLGDQRRENSTTS